VLRRAGDILQAEARAFGAVMTAEMGKLIGAAAAEAEKCAGACRYYADHAERFLQPEVEANGHDAVFFQPLGAVLAVMPWNFPFWQVIRFAAPALAAGNVGLLKHASNVPQCALYLDDLFRRAGFPEGCFQALLIGSDQVERVLRDPRVAAVLLCYLLRQRMTSVFIRLGTCPTGICATTFMVFMSIADTELKVELPTYIVLLSGEKVTQSGMAPIGSRPGPS